MVNAVNNCFVFSFQQEDRAPISLDIPVDIVKRMLAFAYRGSVQDFKECALVCRSWNVLGKEFYRKLYQRVAPHLFGRADYLKYIGGDPGPEFPVPLEYLVKFRPGETLLTFSPKELAFTQAVGTVVVQPRTMVNMEKWSLNAKEGHPIGFNPNSWQAAIAEERPFEESHWSFIDIKLIEKGKSFAAQERVVLASGEKIAGLRDFSISLLMTYVKTGVRHLNWGKTGTYYQWARVPETREGFRLSVGFPATGLYVGYFKDYHATSYIGVIIGRQSFGHELKNGSTEGLKRETRIKNGKRRGSGKRRQGTKKDKI